MNFSYSRTIRFADTDGAGVVYFAQIFSICHEAYEASLASQGINLRDFFGGSAIAVPIVHAEASFRQPMFCGDRIIVTLQTQQLSPDSYEIKYEVYKPEMQQEDIKSQTQSQDEVNQNAVNQEVNQEDIESPSKLQSTFQSKSQLIAQAQTKHICINPHLRSRQELPIYLHQWLHSKYTEDLSNAKESPKV